MKKNGIVPLVNINEESLRNKQIEEQRFEKFKKLFKHNLSARQKSIIDQEYLNYLLTWRDDD